MDKIGIFVCMLDSDINNTNHIVNELKKQYFNKIIIDLYILINNIKERSKSLPINSFAKIIVVNTEIEGKLALFDYVQKNFKQYDYYLFADCDLFFSKDSLFHMYTNLKRNPHYGFTSANSLPIICIRPNNLTIVDRINYERLMKDVFNIKVKVCGAFIMFSKKFFLTRVFFNDLTQINEDRWLSGRYFKQFVPTMNAFFFHILPNNIKDRVMREARGTLGQFLLKPVWKKRWYLSLLNKILECSAKVFCIYLYINKNLGFKIWTNIKSTKPSYYNKDYICKKPKEYSDLLNKVYSSTNNVGNRYVRDKSN